MTTTYSVNTTLTMQDRAEIIAAHSWRKLQLLLYAIAIISTGGSQLGRIELVPMG